MVDVAKVLFLEDALIHATLAGLGESFAGNEIVERFVLVGTNGVASAGLVLNTLMADGTLDGSLSESEVAVDGGETNEELASGLAREKRLGLLLINVTVEPVLAQSIANPIEISVSVVIRRSDGTEPVEKATKVVDVDRLRGLHQIARLVLANEQSAKTLQINNSSILVIEGIGDGDSQELEHLNRKLIPRRLRQTLRVEELLCPEQTTIRILDRHINQNNIQLLQNFGKRGAIVGIGGPAALNQILQTRLNMFRHRRTFTLLADSIAESLIIIVVSEGLLASKKLPEDDAEGINVTLLIESSELHHLRSHPEGLWHDPIKKHFRKTNRRFRSQSTVVGVEKFARGLERGSPERMERIVSTAKK